MLYAFNVQLLPTGWTVSCQSTMQYCVPPSCCSEHNLIIGWTQQPYTAA